MTPHTLAEPPHPSRAEYLNPDAPVWPIYIVTAVLASATVFAPLLARWCHVVQPTYRQYLVVGLSELGLLALFLVVAWWLLGYINEE